MRRALGKGLAQLIGEQADNGPTEVSIDSIEPNRKQPRTHFDEEALASLAQSIKDHGVLQPIVVRPLAEGRYELIAGERRWRASRLAGLKTVPILVRAAGNKAALELALIENIQREDISPLECARAYRQLIDEFGLTQEQVAERVAKSRSGIANTLRLLNLPANALQALEDGKITEGHARAILAIEDPAWRESILQRVLKEGLSVREVEQAAYGPNHKPGRIKVKKMPPAKNPDVVQLEEALSTLLMSPVKIDKSGVGGKISVEFYSDDDLDRILEVLGIRL